MAKIQKGLKRPSIIYLLGYPGVGKYTVACEIATQSGAVVVDNQLINYPILALFNWDGVSQLPPDTFTRITPIRDAVLSAIEEATPRSISYVLTNALEDDAASIRLFERIKRLAAVRGANFLPVFLTCDRDEQLRRVASEHRRAKLKMSSAEALQSYFDSATMYKPNDAHLYTIDTTHITPDAVARNIIERAESMPLTR